jgi:hypothetical protein
LKSRLVDCPDCTSPVSRSATYCRHCGARLNRLPPKAVAVIIILALVAVFILAVALAGVGFA